MSSTLQSPQHGVKQDSGTPAQVPQPAPRLRVYLLALLALPFMLYLLPFALVRLPGFESWGGGDVSPLINFAYHTAGQNADVVIFGDSSPLYGIDPLQMTRELGVKVLNLPNTIGSLAVNDDLPLRRYLADDRAPKLIIFYMAPYNLNYSRGMSNAPDFEGQEILAGNGTASEIGQFVRRHPTALLLFPFRLYEANVKPALAAALHREHREAAIAAGMGHQASVGAALQDPCSLPVNLTRQVPFDGAERLIRTFGGTSTRILFYLAPLPGCTNALPLASRSYAEIGAAHPRLMPPTDYHADKYYIHLLPRAVPDATHALVEAARPLLQ